MKVSRNQLKNVVKECLMEILAEGLLHEVADAPKKKRLTRPRKAAQPVEQKEDRFASAVNETVSGLTNDPIMTSIFRDTAMTTLQDQMSGETPSKTSSGNTLVNEQHTQGPELGDLFGETADRWASLAFPEKKTLP